MRPDDADNDPNTTWESLTYAFTDRPLHPPVIATLLAEYVLRLSIAGRQEDAARWMPLAQLYATLWNAQSTEKLQLVVSDIRDLGVSGR